MTDFSRSAVDAALARRLDTAIQKILDEPAAAKSFPVQIGLAMVRNVARALRGEGQVAAPVRKLHLLGPRRGFDLVQESGRPPDREIVRGEDVTLDDCPACITQQDPESPDAA